MCFQMRVPAAVAPLCLSVLRLVCLFCVVPVAAPSPSAQGLERRTGTLRTSLSPERQGLRPGGALSGLPPALLEWPNRLHDPQPGDLNATQLGAALGRHFDPRIMSVSRPPRWQHKHR